jgi:hypothetical protein
MSLATNMRLAITMVLVIPFISASFGTISPRIEATGPGEKRMMKA